ncbi:MAG: hypothetical protein IPM29_30055 [Planctomycetes bacterium]|nr:hypothetical protein [Planctomycetota bacterium]
MRTRPTTAALLAASLSAALLGGCGSSGGSADQPGTAQIVLTDAVAEDLTAFEVDVSGLVFHKVGGADVAALPRAARVDFAELEELGELVARVSLEPGFYSGVTLTLDFGNALALIAGQTTPAAIVDGDGNPLTGTLAVEITFPTRGRPAIRANRNHVVQLDLDLSQAAEVDVGANRVTFRPVIDAVFDPSDPKPAVARGELASVDRPNARFVIDRLDRSGALLRQITIATNAQTVFQVSGEVFSGDFGLQALEGLPAAARVWVQGTLDPSLPGIRAAAVEAGDGVPGTDQDHVLGVIIGRSAGAGVDAELTVLGRSQEYGTGTRRYFTEFTVQVAYGATHVLARGMAAPLGTDELQVGQQVWCFGDLTGTTLDCSATAGGVVRMLPTTVHGTANAPAANDVLELDLVRIEGVPIARFDFSVASVPEIDPAAFGLDVTGIDVSGVAAGARISATGWFNEVGTPGDADLDATRVVDRSATGAVLLCGFVGQGGRGVLAVEADGTLSYDPSPALIRRILDGFGGRQITATPTPTIVPRQDAGGWRIAAQNGVVVYRSWDLFTADLDARLAAGARVRSLGALGYDDPATQVFTAVTCGVVLNVQ